ncbi:MAG: ribosome biogenesis GTPase Der [Chloroflexota bacterium]
MHSAEDANGSGARAANPPMVALVGRPNVGKSTLFNRIVGRRLAVVHEDPGTTRDRLYADAEWNGLPFTVVDTGGLELLPDTVVAGRRPGPERVLAQDSAPYIRLMRAQAEVALEEADAVIFVTDAISGLTAADEEVADVLRRAECPVFLAANKADNKRLRHEALEFYSLGLGEVHPVSALHGQGVADLLDEVVEALRERGSDGEWVPRAAEGDEEQVELAIVGRPNVGKSSLLNKLLGEERVIVSPVPGTTRDAVDTFLEWEGTPITLVDTAGIRRRGKVARGVEYYSVLRALRALRRADVALLVIDGWEGVRAQDTHIAGAILEEWASVVVLINKWDLVEKDADTVREYTGWVREALQFLDYVPVLFISALTGRGVDRVLPTALDVWRARFHRIPTGELNRIVQDAVARHAPPSKRGRRLKIYYASQPEVDPPTFVFHVNDTRLVHFSYERYLENRLREACEFPGTPIRLLFRPRKRPDLEERRRA